MTMSISRGPDGGGGVFYNKDSKGVWWAKQAAYQCLVEIPMGSQCQGVYGHDGPHWCYDPAGRLCQKDNGDASGRMKGFASQTPPGHDRYVSPVDMAAKYHGNHAGEWRQVTDQQEIADLEAGKVPDGCCVVTPAAATAVTSRPTTIDDLKEAVAEFKKWQNHFVRFGARDTEPDSVFQQALWWHYGPSGVPLGSRTKVVLTAKDWHLYDNLLDEELENAVMMLNDSLELVLEVARQCQMHDPAGLQKALESICWRCC